MNIPSTATVLAIAVLSAFPEPASAACERDKRISHRDAECLAAEWHNPSGMSIFGWYMVRNYCASQGTVVVKIDIKDAQDDTLHLTTSEMRTGTTRTRIRGIYCCTDLSDICSL